MYTTHSLSEMQILSRTPAIHVPRQASREFGVDELRRQMDDVEYKDALPTAHARMSRLVRNVLETLTGLLGRARHPVATLVAKDAAD
jgi:hypothetical protein